jgi:serine phosphatase RsbU (regulator of sigma subunit)
MIRTASFDEDEPVGGASSRASFRGVQISTRITSAHRGASGGDWCEAFAISTDVVALSIGDVCGHGAKTVPVMQRLRRTVRDAACAGETPADALAAGNLVACGLRPETYATAVLAFLDLGAGVITYANAGHPPPLLLGEVGSRYLTDGDPDLPLGIELRAIPTLRRETTLPSMLFVLYTDGVTEHERTPLRGEEQLAAAARFAFESALPSAAVIQAHMGLRGDNHDDVAILTARRR